MKRLLVLIFLVTGALQAKAQTNEQSPAQIQENYQLHIRPSTQAISLDGELSEESWQQAEVAHDFWMKFPKDDVKADRQTEVRITYDDKFLYIGAICYDTSYYVVQTLKRDSRYFDSDGFAVVIDPVNEKTNGFFFGVSPMNVQAEDLINTGAFSSMNFSWDNKWFSEVKRYPDRWVVEMAIPFKTLRFKSNISTWGINFIRNDLKKNQFHSWTHLPINFPLFDLGYMGSMIWERSPEQVQSNISLIPYISGATVQDNVKEGARATTSFDGGFDAKLAVSSSMNLDLTINPDFSQIEVDQQQTNLTRFNLFFPERRTFFLENADIFASFGTPPARPFFSRRIGLDAEGLPIPILFGARLSGNLNQNLRVGLMNVQTRATDERVPENFSTLAFHQRVLSRSLVKGYVSNRQAFIEKSGLNRNDFGRNAGLELNYMNKKGSFNTWLGYHVSDKSAQGLSKQGDFWNLGIGYYGRNLTVFTDYIRMDTDYYADMGFIERLVNWDAVKNEPVRLGFDHFFNMIDYTIRPKRSSFINAHTIGLRNWLDLNPDGSFNERKNFFQYAIQFRNTSRFSLQLQDQELDLLFSTQFQNTILPTREYWYQRFNLQYQSDARKTFAYALNFSSGEFYHGNLNQYIGEITLRRQPWGNFSLLYEHNEFDIPETNGRGVIKLLRQRTEINFSNNLFWTTFFQYNTQRNNFNINSRLQWRYKPMSDFYLVYTDNYFTDPFLKSNNRALVFKLNYWLTI